MNLSDLKKDLPYKFKVQTAQQYGAIMVAYVDSRIVQDLLDDVVGPGNWQDKYYEVKGNVYCSIGIKCEDGWVWKSDCGTAGNIETEKSEASDAFKRAGVKWGIARFLYSLPQTKLNTIEYKGKNGKSSFKPVDGNNNILWDGDSQTAYCMLLKGKSPPKKNPQKPPAKKPELPKALAVMNEHEQAAMTSVFLIKIADKPKGMDDKLFKFEAATKLYESMGHWPTTQQEQEEAIAFLDKEYTK
jgi:hypothetical protein